MNDESQQRIWFLSQGILSGGLDFERILSNAYIISSVFLYQDKKEDEQEIDRDLVKSVEDLSKKLVLHQNHKIIRSQKEINTLKIDVNSTIAKIITSINPNNMIDFPIAESF